MSRRYSVTFLPAARDQIALFLVGSRLRQWREELIIRLDTDLRADPWALGEGRDEAADRILIREDLIVEFAVDEANRRVVVRSVRLNEPL
jgi:hypothetical protein